MTTNAAKPAGITLIAVSALALFAMAHHPTIDSPTIDAALAELGHERWLNSLVHGTMIAVVALYHWAFTVLGHWLGPERPSVGLAGTALAFATALMTGAALVSGFATPEFAERALAADTPLGDPRTPLVLLFAINQSMAYLGTLAYGAALIGWGIALIRTPLRYGRLLAAFGIAAGAAMIGALWLDRLSLNVTGMTLVVVGLGLWACGAGLMLLRAKR